MSATILCIDPGATTGWCVYAPAEGRVVAAGTFRGHDMPEPLPEAWTGVLAVAIERPRGYGPTRPQVVDCAYVCGRLIGKLERHWLVHERTRHEVCKVLSDAVHGVIHVRSDATAWAALRMLHGGDGADDKGKKPDKHGNGGRVAGPLAGVTAHERAALAVGYAVSKG